MHYATILHSSWIKVVIMFQGSQILSFGLQKGDSIRVRSHCSIALSEKQHG